MKHFYSLMLLASLVACSASKETASSTAAPDYRRENTKAAPSMTSTSQQSTRYDADANGTRSKQTNANGVYDTTNASYKTMQRIDRLTNNSGLNDPANGGEPSFGTMRK